MSNYLDGSASPAKDIKPYTGYAPSNVSRDARYTSTTDGRVRVQFELGAGEFSLLSTDEHAELVAMVRAAKRTAREPEAGVFYINEYGHVLVKAAGETLFAGVYRRPVLCRNDEAGLASDPVAPDSLAVGDDWPGTHVGIKYTLTADGADIRYIAQSRPGVQRRVMLSATRTGGARELTERMARFKARGGSVYINEAMECFAPITRDRTVQYVYLGPVTSDEWFPEPVIS